MKNQDEFRKVQQEAKELYEWYRKTLWPDTAAKSEQDSTPAVPAPNQDQIMNLYRLKYRKATRQCIRAAKVMTSPRDLAAVTRLLNAS